MPGSADVLNDAPDTRNDQASRPPSPQVKSQVVWLPAVVVLLAFHVVTLITGLRGSLPTDARVVYVSSMVLLGMSVLLLLHSSLHRSSLSMTFGVITLAMGVAADIFVAASTATGAFEEGLGMAFLLLAIWATVWSVTGSHSVL